MLAEPSIRRYADPVVPMFSVLLLAAVPQLSTLALWSLLGYAAGYSLSGSV